MVQVASARASKRTATRVAVLALLAFSSLLMSGCGGDERTRLGSDLAGWPRTESSRVEDEFGAMLLVTSDQDWRTKWDTSPETIPRFNTVSRLSVGQRASILTFFTNPKLDASGQARVLCDLKCTRPDDTIAFDLKDVVCEEGEPRSPVTYVRLSPAVCEFIGEDSDPIGIWKTEVRVKDMVRGTSIDLKTSFELIAR